MWGFSWSSGLARYPLLRPRTYACVAAAAAAHNELPNTTTHKQELIQFLCEEGQLDKAMDVLPELENPLADNLYISLLRACSKSKDLSHVKSVYFHLVRHEDRPSFLVGDYLVMTLAKCGALDEACQLFGFLGRRTVYSWTSLISAFVDWDRVHEAFHMYHRMQRDRVEPDNFTYVSLFRACGCIGDLNEGKRLHAEARRKGLGSDLFISNTLVSMYGRCGAVHEAESVFQGIYDRDIVSWCALLCTYVDNGQAEKALHLYRQARMEGVCPDSRMFVFTLQACNLLADKEDAAIHKGQRLKARPLEIGRALHSDAHRDGFTSDVFVGTALVVMYGKCQAIAEAELVLCALPLRRVISWNALLTAYIELGQEKKALWLYRQVLKESEMLDDVTFLCILQASSETGFVEICKHLHFEVVCAGLDSIFSVVATLIHAYGSSASMIDAQVVFDELQELHTASWNTNIAGNAGEGNEIQSLQIFEALRLTAGLKPDEVTFLIVLSACSHSGLVAQALEYFDSMTRNHDLVPDSRHYGIMINLLGRAGNFRHIEGMLRQMPIQANLSVWLCLLGACRLHGNVAFAMEAFKQAVRLQPTHVTAYVLMSNIYGDAGLHKCADDVEQLRKERCGEEDDIYIDEQGLEFSF
ncbi:hypothetical protein L7F22_011534 [Adiantum nelumboides]|nr:hypothetical protein [Adiantum nelumboides]